jgi:hypothetical protein
MHLTCIRAAERVRMMFAHPGGNEMRVRDAKVRHALPHPIPLPEGEGELVR